jgi:hypothetical protein
MTLYCLIRTHIVFARLLIRRCCSIWLRRSVCNMLFSMHGAISLAGPAPGRPRYARALSCDISWLLAASFGLISCLPDCSSAAAARFGYAGACATCYFARGARVLAAPGRYARAPSCRVTPHDPLLPHSDSYRVCQIAHVPLLLDLATQERVQHAIFNARPVRASALVRPFVTPGCLVLARIVQGLLISP